MATAFQVRLTGSKNLVLGKTSADSKPYGRVEVDGKRTVTLDEAVVREWLKLDDKIRTKFLQPKKEGALGLDNTGASLQFKSSRDENNKELFCVTVTTGGGGAFTVVERTYETLVDAVKLFYERGLQPANSQKVALEDVGMVEEFANTVAFELLLVPRYRCRGCATAEPSQDDHDCLTLEPRELEQRCLDVTDVNLFRTLVCLAVKVWCEEYCVNTCTYLYLLEALKDLCVPRKLKKLRKAAEDFDPSKVACVRRVLQATVGAEEKLA